MRRIAGYLTNKNGKTDQKETENRLIKIKKEKLDRFSGFYGGIEVEEFDFFFRQVTAFPGGKEAGGFGQEGFVVRKGVGEDGELGAKQAVGVWNAGPAEGGVGEEGVHAVEDGGEALVFLRGAGKGGGKTHQEGEADVGFVILGGGGVSKQAGAEAIDFGGKAAEVVRVKGGTVFAEVEEAVGLLVEGLDRGLYHFDRKGNFTMQQTCFWRVAAYFAA